MCAYCHIYPQTLDFNSAFELEITESNLIMKVKPIGSDNSQGHHVIRSPEISLLSATPSSVRRPTDLLIRSISELPSIITELIFIALIVRSDRLYLHYAHFEH